MAKKKGGSTIEKIFDRYGNEFSIYETVMEVDKETIIK